MVLERNKLWTLFTLIKTAIRSISYSSIKRFSSAKNFSSIERVAYSVERVAYLEIDIQFCVWYIFDFKLPTKLYPQFGKKAFCFTSPVIES